MRASVCSPPAGSAISWSTRISTARSSRRCADKDAAFLRTLPRNKLHAGSSEILNWVAVAGAAEALDLDWFEYVPGYRTPAGTGTGMSFATWR